MSVEERRATRIECSFRLKLKTRLEIFYDDDDGLTQTDDIIIAAVAARAGIKHTSPAVCTQTEIKISAAAATALINNT